MRLKEEQECNKIRRKNEELIMNTKKRKKTQIQDGNIKRKGRKNRMVKQENKKKKKKGKKTRSVFVRLCVSVIRSKEKNDENRGRTEKIGWELKNKMKTQKKNRTK